MTEGTRLLAADWEPVGQQRGEGPGWSEQPLLTPTAVRCDPVCSRELLTIGPPRSRKAAQRCVRWSRELPLCMAPIAGTANQAVAAGGCPSAEGFCRNKRKLSLIRGSSPENTVRGRLRTTRPGKESNATMGKLSCFTAVMNFLFARFASMAESVREDENATQGVSWSHGGRVALLCYLRGLHTSITSGP